MVICVRKPSLAFLSAVFWVLFLAACGDLDTILPSSVTYQVSALVGRTSLDDYSVVKTDDEVQPVFINPVLKDPDLTGLLVYLLSPEGEIVGKKVYYLLKTGEDQTEPSQNPAQDGTQDPVYDGNAETALDGPGEEENSEKNENRPIDPAEGKETRIHVSRLDKDLPAFPFPENLKLGLYSLVFEVLGEKQTLYQTERRIYYIGDAEFTLGDIQSYLPGLSAGSFLIPPGLFVMLETQAAVDERLDPYIVWYDGKRRIAEGRIAEGSGCFLWEAPIQTGFHTIRAELFPFKPAGVSFGTESSRTTGRSSVRELRGKVKELALPVSERGGKPVLFVPEGGKILRWYQFAGNIRDSMANGNRGNLTGNNVKDLHWVPSEGIYGLSVKTGDTYQFPYSSFTMDEDKHGGASFLLRVKPLTEGTLLSASFKAADSPGNALTMSIVYREQSLQLNLESEGLKAAGSLLLNTLPEGSMGAGHPSPQGFITVEAGFYARGNIFTAALSMAEDGNFEGATMLPGLFQADSSAAPDNSPANSVEIELSNPLSGEISCILGTSHEQLLQLPAREIRAFTAEKNAEETLSAVEPATPAAAVEDLAPAGTLGSFSAQAPRDQGSSQTEPYPLAIFDELALISRNPVHLPNK
jgi:hypothetical protein